MVFGWSQGKYKLIDSVIVLLEAKFEGDPLLWWPLLSLTRCERRVHGIWSVGT